jgi:Spy/CpxP family protein refolding chaperone
MRKSYALVERAPWWAAAVLLCCYLIAGQLPGQALGAEEPPAKKTEHPLPKYFDKLDLTAEQQKKVFAVMDEYDDKLEQHLEQIRKLRGKPFVTGLIIAHATEVKKLRGQRAAALEKVLTDDQRARLKELRTRDEADKKP